MHLYLVPIGYGCGGGDSLLIKAESIEIARTKASEYFKKFGNFSPDNSRMLSEEIDFGEISDFDLAVISYYE